MKIHGLDNLTISEINDELSRGGKFVIYQYCISIVVMTFKRSSGIYFIKSDQSAFKSGAGWTLLTFLLGWWGIPWGPIYTIGSLITNFGGGKNVTEEVLAAVTAQPSAAVS